MTDARLDGFQRYIRDLEARRPQGPPGLSPSRWRDAAQPHRCRAERFPCFAQFAQAHRVPCTRGSRSTQELS